MTTVFDDILQSDEQIIKIYKPNKKAYYRNAYLPFIIFPVIIFSIILLALILPAVIIYFCYKKNYDTSYYCYTNKRLIIRHGVFGANYESLWYKDVTSTSVNVSLIDKGLNTGNLTFKSPSIHSTHNNMPRYFTFYHIENPYKVIKEIGEYIDKNNK